MSAHALVEVSSRTPRGDDHGGDRERPAGRRPRPALTTRAAGLPLCEDTNIMPPNMGGAGLAIHSREHMLTEVTESSETGVDFRAPVDPDDNARQSLLMDTAVYDYPKNLASYPAATSATGTSGGRADARRGLWTCLGHVSGMSWTCPSERTPVEAPGDVGRLSAPRLRALRCD